MDNNEILKDAEVIASEKRAKRLEEINKEMSEGANSEMADILARIQADNNKFKK